MLLVLVTPTLECGKNGHASFSREFYNAYMLFQLNDEISDFINTWFVDNSQNYAYFLVDGLKVLKSMHKRNVIGKINRKPFKLTITSENNGINAENTVLNFSGFCYGSKNDDLNGVDGYFYNDPVQIKSIVHGKEDTFIYTTTEQKKIGISVINANKAELFEILKR